MSKEVKTDYELYELCKEVYEKTGWECGGEYVYHHNGLVSVVQGRPAGDYWENNWWFPLYTSDDLLKKLPGHITLTVTTHDDIHVHKDDCSDYQASACFQSNIKGLLMKKAADTPPKALLKLTIALSEAGELEVEL